MDRLSDIQPKSRLDTTDLPPEDPSVMEKVEMANHHVEELQNCILRLEQSQQYLDASLNVLKKMAGMYPYIKHR